MKTTITTLLLVFTVLASLAQKPKQHIYYDTVKTVKERVDYTPDTISVYFKEIGRMSQGDFHGPRCFDCTGTALGDSVIYERWNKGYLVWYTYKKVGGSISFGNSTSGTYIFNGQPNYYKDEYIFTNENGKPGTFLYDDRKTVCKNIVVYCIKR